MPRRSKASRSATRNALKGQEMVRARKRRLNELENKGNGDWFNDIWTELPAVTGNICDQVDSIQKRRPKSPSCFGRDESWLQKPTEPIVTKEPATTLTTATTEAPSKPLEEWEIKKQLCRCCLVEGTFDSVHSPAPGDDITYDDMLMQCFSIELFPVSSEVTTALYGVCGLCAARLRDAHAFRQQVSATEARFRDLYTRNCITVSGAATKKLEMEQDIDSYFDFGMDDTDTDTVESGLRSRVQRKRKVEPSPKINNVLGMASTGGSMLRSLLLKGKRKVEPRPRKKKNDRKSQSQKKVATAPAQTRKKYICHKPTDECVWTNGAYKCTQCERTCAERYNLIMHFRRVHLGQKTRFKCKLCKNDSFTNKGQLVKHKLEEHNIDDRHKCGACDKIFYVKKQLQIHIDVFHMMGDRTKCSMCDFESFSPFNLKRHMVTHKTSKDFQCKYCKKSFLRKTTLTLHEKIHTGDKQKQCAECGQAFVQKASLNYHMVKYHPEVKF